VKLGDIQLMQAGQPLSFDAKTASKYLKDTCAEHGTVKIFVAIGKGSGKGKLPGLAPVI
jgi:glutamate N-acetyltransferase/amino-acid N-acetyltransferase